VRGRWALPMVVNLVAALVAVLAFTAWKHLKSVQGLADATHMEGSITAGFYEQEIDDVGFISMANKHVTARKFLGTQVIYDAVYTTGADHFRVVPVAVEQPEHCVLLFGDSFTFGEGVSDSETSAAQIVRKSEGRVAAKNFGIGGWGPHQFLAGLQSGRFQRAVTCTPSDAFYLIIPYQIARAAGRGPWDKHGPLFRLGSDGRPVRVGNFDTDGGFSWRQLIGLNALTDTEEADLTTALILEGAHELEQQYGGIRLHVLVWNTDSSFPLKIMERAELGMAAGGLAMHSMEAVIPHFSEVSQKYVIPLEGHPNPRAYERIADYILREIRLDKKHE
jgi:hypothetical protein